MLEEAEKKVSPQKTWFGIIQVLRTSLKEPISRGHQFLDARYYARARGRLSTNFDAFGVAF